MKYCLYFIFIGFVYLVGFKVKSNNLFPNLPLGKYRINFRAILKCSIPNSNIQYNFYLNKISTNKTELRGNMTLKVPIDDSLTFHTNLAVKDSIGGWKENAHILKLSNGCTSYKILLGSNWESFLKSFGINNTNCPIVPGIYVSKGYDLTINEPQSNIMNSFFYGTYKCRVYFTDKLNDQQGCVIFVIEVKRLWETE